MTGHDFVATIGLGIRLPNGDPNQLSAVGTYPSVSHSKVRTMRTNQLSAHAGMRRRGKLAVATGSLVTVSALLLAGCSAADSSGGSDASGGTVELTMMNHSRGQEAALGMLAEQYEEETGVVVTVDTPGPADYVAKLQAAAQANDMPDVYTAVGATDMAPFYKAGWALRLDDELADGWSDNFTPAVLELTAFPEGNPLEVPAGSYAAYWELATFGLLVQPETAGIDAANPPTTIDEMIDEFNDGTFSVAASLTPSLLQSYASNYMTDEEINATFTGDAPWTTDAWENTFQLLVDLTEGGVIANDALPGGSDDNPTVEKSFFNIQDTGAIFDGSWAVAVAKTTAPDFTDYVSMVLPAASDGDYEPRSPGVTGRGAAVNAKGDHVDEALAFVKWLTEPEQQKVFVDEAGMIPTNPELLDSLAVPDQIAGMASAIGDIQIVPVQLTADVNDAIIRGSQSIVLGEKTVEQVLEEVQTAQDQSS
ncbi:ABC transporter substrate-binding protein [Agromyces kandeliae]|uniref:Extracellular solute-binding protein n=1 Tax=Agromyces kandeliae TaxID=2666141 RepID=A0A6L5R7H9_9MICO|nr:extracellular solute-binding protein [Agromyces kandeliae]MRX45237.1 extracellular solute-binding protein [Agromyces kandeliae]